MKYQDILERVEHAAATVLGDIRADWDDPEELAEEGIAPWDERTLEEVWDEVGNLFGTQFLEVLPLKPEDHLEACETKGGYLGKCDCGGKEPRRIAPCPDHPEGTMMCAEEYDTGIGIQNCQYMD
jgi:hypothetical protein